MFYLEISINDSHKQFPLIVATSNKTFNKLSDASDRAKLVSQILPAGSIVKVRKQNPISTIVVRMVSN